jgi:hypothetical protein
MKRITPIILILFSLFSCEKSSDVTVKYLATDAISPYTVTYRVASGDLVTEEVAAASAQDEWSYSFIASEGEIVYLSANYKEITSGIKVMILIDGKIYKQASSQYDTIKYIIVSGTIPY